MKFKVLAVWCALTVIASCADEQPASPDVDMGTNDDPNSWTWNLPEGFPRPRVPENNPMTLAKFELGRRLFYDTRLSKNETQSCGSCHFQELAFTDGMATSIGSTGESTPRGAMMLGNVAYLETLTWANPLLRTLEKQMLTPLFGEAPVELGHTDVEEMLDRLREDEIYPELFEAVFGEPIDGDKVIDLDRTTKAIAAFQRGLVTADSPYDRYIYGGDSSALTEQQQRGMELFFSERLECFHCHGSFNLSDSVTHENSVFEEIAFHNNGLYNVGGSGAYPQGNQGLFDITGVLEDSGRFRAPSLRNIAVTGPYMHDGRLETLSDVVDHYARGGTLTEDGPNAGDGKLNPFKSSLITGFIISDSEKEDLLAFFEALTDQTFLTNPAYADPFQSEDSP